MGVFDEIQQIYDQKGAQSYGEGVSQMEHALQCAALAEQDGAPPSLVAAALLHDVGHMLHKHDERIAERGVDAKHEAIGGGWLAKRFGPDVAEPVRLHVAAKRYLCAKRPGYFDGLSAASVRSLALQGGPMSGDEVAAFEVEDYYQQALALRQWDEGAKVVGAISPAFDSYRELIEDLARP